MKYPVYTKDMKATHTILVPNMLPVHFRLIIEILRQDGYNVELIETTHRGIVDEGLRSVHNDTCYPALLVIGQLLDALKSGKYDPHRTVLMISQTGGGCRASNYIHLLRKALAKSEFSYVPVVSLNFTGMEESEFKLTIPLLIKASFAIMFGDLLMHIANQCRPYELEKGATDAVVDKWVDRLGKQFRGGGFLSVAANYRGILNDFAAIERVNIKKPRVGIVGEIYVKYAPLGNNNLEQFLLDEGTEPVVPGLLDFCLYCANNSGMDRKLYGRKGVKSNGGRLAYRYLLMRQRQLISKIKKHGVFDPPCDFEHLKEVSADIIGQGVKMGEGWLLTAEMCDLVDSGIRNVICTQPFGCLPNHIVAKGMTRAVKEKYPQANIVSIDYDPGATRINQENRIKLMLAMARQAEKAEQPVADGHPHIPAPNTAELVPSTDAAPDSREEKAAVEVR